MQMGCPNCGGALELTAPDKAERVTCPYCNSLLDVNQGKSVVAQSAFAEARSPSFALPIGADGTFTNDTKFKIIGAIVRSVTIEGIKYFWHEYLLYNSHIGFAGSRIRTITGILSSRLIRRRRLFNQTARASPTTGKNYKIFQDAPATIEYVTANFTGASNRAKLSARLIMSRRR